MKTKRGVSKKGAFLAAFVVTANVTKAAKAAGIARELHYRWLRQDPEYVTAFEDAKEQAAQTLEDEAIRRAKDGVQEPVIYQGQLCYRQIGVDDQGRPVYSDKPLVVRKYSDALLMFLLRGMRPDKYRERVSQEVTFMDGVAQRLAAARKRMRKKKDEDEDE